MSQINANYPIGREVSFGDLKTDEKYIAVNIHTGQTYMVLIFDFGRCGRHSFAEANILAQGNDELRGDFYDTNYRWWKIEQEKELDGAYWRCGKCYNCTVTVAGKFQGECEKKPAKIITSFEDLEIGKTYKVNNKKWLKEQPEYTSKLVKKGRYWARFENECEIYWGEKFEAEEVDIENCERRHFSIPADFVKVPFATVKYGDKIAFVSKDENFWDSGVVTSINSNRAIIRGKTIPTLITFYPYDNIYGELK